MDKPKNRGCGVKLEAIVTYVPGFWSVKGLKSTLLTNMAWELILTDQQAMGYMDYEEKGKKE